MAEASVETDIIDEVIRVNRLLVGLAVSVQVWAVSNKDGLSGDPAIIKESQVSEE